MNREDIIKLAMEYGFTGGYDAQGNLTFDAAFVEAVEEAAAAEREACAKVCIEQSARWHTDQRDVYVAHECAAAIRARGTE